MSKAVTANPLAAVAYRRYLRGPRCLPKQESDQIVLTSSGGRDAVSIAFASCWREDVYPRHARYQYVALRFGLHGELPFVPEIQSEMPLWVGVPELRPESE